MARTKSEKVIGIDGTVAELCLWVTSYTDCIGQPVISAVPVLVGGKEYESDSNIRIPRNWGSEFSRFYDYRVEYHVADSDSYDRERTGRKTWVYETRGFIDTRVENAATAKGMMQTLEQVDKALAKMDEDSGYLPSDAWGLKFSRIVNALRIKKVLFDGGKNGSGMWGFDAHTYQVYTPGQAGGRIEHMIEKAREGKGDPKPERMVPAE